MPLFVIDPDNVIRPLDEGTEPKPDDTPFSSLKEFVAVSQARNWSKADVTDIWNGFAGEAGPFADLKPQKMFKNRLYGLQTIWKAIQRLTPGPQNQNWGSLEQTYQDTPAVEQAEREVLDNTTQDTMKPKKNRKPKPEKTAREPRKTASKAEKRPATPRTGTSTKVQALEMMKRKTGATAEEITERLGWSKTSVSMFTQWIKLVTGCGVTSFSVEKNGKGERVYKAA